MDKYIEKYLNSLINQSEKTVKAYTRDLKMFNDYMDSEGCPIITATLEELQRYARYLKIEKKYSESTMNRRLQLVKYLYKHLKRTGYITENPSEFLSLPKIPERDPKFLSMKEAKKLISSINKEKNEFLKLRDMAMIKIFLYNGLRVSEVASLKTTNIKGQHLTFIGKGNKERTVVLNNDLLTAINNYLEIRPEVSTKTLFLTVQKKPIQIRAIQLMFKKYMDKAGLESHGIHTLRHTAAVMMLQRGVGIRTIQKLYGHSSVETTEIYATVTEESKKDAADKMEGIFAIN